MSKIWLRPDLRTPGGEVCDVMYDGFFAGLLTLVYRESDKMTGTLQLDEESLNTREKAEVCDIVHRYVQQLIDALQLEECEVMVTYSAYDHVISTDRARRDYIPLVNVEEDMDVESDWVDHDSRFEDEELGGQDQLTLREARDFRLVVTSETESTLRYRLYDQAQVVATAMLRLEDSRGVGVIDWHIDPEDEELDNAADLLALDVEDREIDSLYIEMRLDGEVIDAVELTTAELEEEAEEEPLHAVSAAQDQYTLVLAREDGDVLSYEIYEQSHGGLPIGTATVDVGDRQITGFVDFREPGSSDDREEIAMQLMQELEKEKDYDVINLSMMHRNRLIEQMIFETEQVH